MTGFHLRDAWPLIELYCEMKRAGVLAKAFGMTFTELSQLPAELVEQLEIIHETAEAFIASQIDGSHDYA